MRENRLRNLWREDKAVVNGWFAIPSTFSAETMAHQGWDSLTIDMQHGVIDYQMAVNMLHGGVHDAHGADGAGALARSRHHHEVLDAGAYAVICPMVNSRAEAEKLVVRYCAIRRGAAAASARSARCSMAAPTIRPSTPTTR